MVKPSGSPEEPTQISSRNTSSSHAQRTPTYNVLPNMGLQYNLLNRKQITSEEISEELRRITLATMD